MRCLALLLALLVATLALQARHGAAHGEEEGAWDVAQHRYLGSPHSAFGSDVSAQYDLQAPAANSLLVAGSVVPILYTGGPSYAGCRVQLSLIDVDRWQVWGPITPQEGIPCEQAQFVWTVPSQLNTSSSFQVYISDLKTTSWHYGPVFTVTNDNGFTFRQPLAASVFSANSPIYISWTGGLAQWNVQVALVNVTGWIVQASVTNSLANTALGVTWTLPPNLKCTDTYQFYISDVKVITWAYGPTFTITDCSGEEQKEGPAALRDAPAPKIALM